MPVSSTAHFPSGMLLASIMNSAPVTSMSFDTTGWNVGRRFRITGRLNFNAAAFALSCSFNGVTYERAVSSRLTNTAGVPTFTQSADMDSIQGETTVDMILEGKRLLTIANYPRLHISSALCRVSSTVLVGVETFANSALVASGTGLDSFALNAVTDAFSADSYLHLYDAGPEPR
jgi:hypothetical protein